MRKGSSRTREMSQREIEQERAHYIKQRDAAQTKVDAAATMLYDAFRIFHEIGYGDNAQACEHALRLLPGQMP